MGREFEVKYAATEEDLACLAERFPNLHPIAMETTYYDTPDRILSRLHWTFRRRMENGVSVCTLKTPAAGLGRNEWEIPCEDIADAVDILCAQGAPEELKVFVSGGLIVSCGAKFTRLAATLQIPDATVEIALDRGVLMGGDRELPFAEVEVELKEGSEDAALRFARDLAASRNLKPELRSKVARASALAEH